MLVIKKRTNCFAVLTGTGLGICILILLFSDGGSKIYIQLIFGNILGVSSLLAVLWVREYKKLRTAKLIADNKIIHINLATINGINPGKQNGIEALISYFGILLGSTIIKFNQDHIRLMAVEIASDFISFTYGTEKRVQSTRIICQVMDKKEIRRIVESFKYETGITPTIIY